MGVILSVKFFTLPQYPIINGNTMENNNSRIFKKLLMVKFNKYCIIIKIKTIINKPVSINKNIFNFIIVFKKLILSKYSYIIYVESFLYIMIF